MSSIDEIVAPVADYLDLFEERLGGYLKAENELIYELTKHLLSSRGKRVRPLTLFLAAGAAGHNEEKSLSPAIAIELIHTATLLHDDVIDQSKFRRGIETISYRWGNLTAVLTGDYYFAKAFKILVNENSPGLLKAVSAATEQVSIGELGQIQELNNTSLSEENYVNIISNKTAALFSCAGECGAIIAGANGTKKTRLIDYGKFLGVAFQIADDLLDFVGDEKKLGKGVGNDLKEGWFTLPLIYSLKNGSPAGASEIIKILENGFREEQFLKVLEFIEDTGGIDYARGKASLYRDKALESLKSIDDSDYKRALIKLAEFTVAREK
ncbi:MAG: octaprenyl diphosphate synthase [candidate division Zixibacteria bacterium]|nr:octaprenyl diphosphate synthase [candidate division Zixibacteria bacterium]